VADPRDDDPSGSGGAERVERVRARVSVTNARMARPVIEPGPVDDEDNIFGATLSGTPRPPPSSSTPLRTDPSLSNPPAPTSGSGPAERPGPPSRQRTGLTVVRAAELQAAPAPPAPTLAPSMLPPRRVQTTPPAAPPPPPLVDLDSLMAPTGAPPPPMPPGPPALSTTTTPRPAPPAPLTRATMSLDPPVEPSQPGRRAPAAMSLDPPVEPSSGRTRRPTGLMSLDPPVEPSGPTKRADGGLPPPMRTGSHPSMSIPSGDGPPMAPRKPLPSGLREDGTPLGAAEAALPGLFKAPEPVAQRRRIQIAATGVGFIALAIATVVLWAANRPPPPRTGSVHFAVTDKATVTRQHLAGLARVDNADVAIIVTRIVTSVARNLVSKDAPPPEVVLTRDPEPVAFSTPDGRLVVSQGMLMTLSSQAELAALAAHLLAHQTRFQLDDAIDAEAKTLVPEVRAAIGSNMATPGGTRVATVGQWHTFSETEEQEADADAVLALKRANWDATAVRTLWQRLESAKPALVAHHPLTPGRITALETAEQLRLPGSDLVRGDVGRTNSVEYQAQIKDALAPPVVAKAPPAEPAPTSTTIASEPVATRLTTPVAAPKQAPKKQPAPEPPAPPTPSSPRDPND
jgi:hypothetical protein